VTFPPLPQPKLVLDLATPENLFYFNAQETTSTIKINAAIKKNKTFILLQHLFLL